MSNICCLRITPDNEIQTVEIPYNLNLQHNYLKVYFPNRGNKQVSEIYEWDLYEETICLYGYLLGDDEMLSDVVLPKPLQNQKIIRRYFIYSI